MTSSETQRILIISPAKDEGQYISRTINTMINQTHRPALWIIVDDGSSDNTGDLAEAAALEHDWIKVIRRQKGTERKVGPGVIDAFYAGLDTVDLNDFDYICKMDADIELNPIYFAELLKRFEANPKLGTASGKASLVIDGKLVPERINDQFSQGCTKLFRKECFQEIGGFVREVMWDGIDCHRCRMFGWEARSYSDEELTIVHLRQMGSSYKSIYHGRMRWGYGQYFMGTHPLYLLGISTYRMLERPWIIGGLCIMAGYVKSWWQRKPRYNDARFRTHLHRWQMSELWHRMIPFHG